MTSLALALQRSTGRLKQPSVLFGLLAALVFATLVALLERRGGSGAADRSLTGVSFGLVLPLAAWSVVRKTCVGGGLEAAFTDLARHGADRRILALGQFVAAAAFCSLLGICLGALGVLAARGVEDPATLNDVWASVSVGAAAGAAYACWFMLGSTFGKRSGGRTAFLAFDWLLGSTASVLSLPFPRAHVQNLLGGTAPVDLSQGSSAALLTGLSFLYLALAIYRIPR